MICNDRCNVRNSANLPGADVENTTQCRVTVHSSEHCIDHIIDVNEISKHFPILKQRNTPPLIGKATKQGYNSRIGIGERLARPINVLKAQNFEPDSISV